MRTVWRHYASNRGYGETAQIGGAAGLSFISIGHRPGSRPDRVESK